VSANSAIEWTEATWNPVRGCTKVSPGCKNCYAETFAERWRGIPGHPFEQGFDLRLVPEKLDQPLHWKRGRRIFVNSMADLFHEGVPFEYIAAVFGVMAACPQHTFQVLTKRPARITLEITDVRIERVQDISAEDARSEGIPALSPAPTAEGAYAILWDSINGKRPGCSWAANPWVWCVSFRRLP
jgi:protein gp37